MGLVKYNITERDFDRTKSDQYELSILFGVDSFAYLIRQEQSRRILAFRSVELPKSNGDYSQKMLRAVQEDDILRLNLIRQLHIAWMSPVCSLVPERLYNPEAKSTYLKHLTELPSDFECLADQLPQLDTRLVYGMPVNKRDAIVRRFSPRAEHHISTSLITEWAKTPGAQNDRVVFAHFRDSRVLIACFEQGQIKFFNTFGYQDAKDALYFVILAYRQCVWSPIKIPLYLSGELTEDSAVYRQLYRFVKTLSFYHSSSLQIQAVGPALKSVPSYVFADLLSIGRV
ncbi:MAG: DUF3822 family protein [Bacteroidota bacterium]